MCDITCVAGTDPTKRNTERGRTMADSNKVQAAITWAASYPALTAEMANMIRVNCKNIDDCDGTTGLLDDLLYKVMQDERNAVDTWQNREVRRDTIIDGMYAIRLLRNWMVKHEAANPCELCKGDRYGYQDYDWRDRAMFLRYSEVQDGGTLKVVPCPECSGIPMKH